jgi:sugar lactone lactonase YvrE
MNPIRERSVILWVVMLACGVASATAQTAAPVYVFSTLAGPTVGGPGTADGTGTAAQFYNPSAVAADSSGNLYVADTGNNLIRKITQAGVVTTLAGTAGLSGDADATGAAARFNQPSGVAVDSSGNVYVADTYNYTIRKISPFGVVTTIAGLAGLSGDLDATGSAARFHKPSSVAVDGSGNLYVTDSDSDTIREINSGGVVTTLAGTVGQSGSADGTGAAARFNVPSGVAVDSSGVVYVSDTNNNAIRKITQGGVVTTLAGMAGQPTTGADGTGAAARFNKANGLAVDLSGNVYVADTYNDTIRMVTSGGVVTTLAGTAQQSGSADGTGTVARFSTPSGVAVDSLGNIYVADSGNATIRMLTQAGAVTTLAGLTAQPQGSADGTGTDARFNQPTSVAVDVLGNVYVADSGNDTIRKITPNGVVTTFAGAAGQSGSEDGTGADARFSNPLGLSIDDSGNIIVADTGNETIRMITPAGVVTTLAGTAEVLGDVNVTPVGEGTTTAGAPGVSGDKNNGGLGTFYRPEGVAGDSSVEIYIADTGNNLIRFYKPPPFQVGTEAGSELYGSSDGDPSAASFNAPRSLAMDGSGRLYVADTVNSAIRIVYLDGFVVNPSTYLGAGTVETLAGTPGQPGNGDGTGEGALFNNPVGVACDLSGNVYVADTGNFTIRRIVITPSAAVAPFGAVTTLAGSAGEIGIADGAGSAARFNFPSGVAVDSIGNIYVADTGNNAIRKGVPTGSSFPIISMQPSSQTVAAGTSVMLGVAAAGVGLTYQWQFNGSNIPGATGTMLTLANIATNQAGIYRVIVTGQEGFVPSSSATVAVNAISHLTNLSARAYVGTGSQILVAGFVARGPSPKQILIRGDGPALSQFQVAGVLANPQLALFDSTPAIIATNTGWNNASSAGTSTVSAVFQPATTGAFDQVSAFLVPAGSADCAMLALLPSGAYTAQVSGVGNTAGVALAEVYDADTGTPASHLINLSARAFVGTGSQVLIGGFNIYGGSSETVLIRGIGPALSQFGVTGVLVSPQLTLYDSAGNVVATNAGWGSVPVPGNSTVQAGLQAATAAVMSSVNAFALMRGLPDCAMVATLPPGSYTAEVSGVGGVTGVALVEVYDIP